MALAFSASCSSFTRAWPAPGALRDLRALLAVPDNYRILFLQGGGLGENAINVEGGMLAWEAAGLPTA